MNARRAVLAAALVGLFVSLGGADERPRSLCRERIEELGGLCLLYAEDHGGRMPAKLSDLYYEAYAFELSLFECPCRDVPIRDRERIDALSGYVLLPPGAGPGPHPVLRDLTARNHGGEGVHVFLSDGTVRWEPAGSGEAEPEPAATSLVVPLGGNVVLGAETRALRAGILVEEVQSGGVAARWGLRRRDVITRFRGRSVLGRGRLADLLEGVRPGESVPLEVRRGEETLEIEAEVVDPAAAPRPAKLSLGVEERVSATAARISCRIRYRDAPARCRVRLVWRAGGKQVAGAVAGLRGSGELVAAVSAGSGGPFHRGVWTLTASAGGAELGSATFRVE